MSPDEAHAEVIAWSIERAHIRLAEVRTKSVYTALFALDAETGRVVVDEATRLVAELQRLLRAT